MEIQVTPTGIPGIGALSWGTHVCQFYEGREDLADYLVPYFKTGLEHEEYCLWVTADPLSVEDAQTLLRAAELGVGEGLRYVYAGNLPGRVGPFENTHCPSCRALLIERVGYTILRDLVTPGRGVCPSCSARIPGRW